MERELKSLCTHVFQAASCSSGWPWILNSQRNRRTFSPSWKNSFPTCLREMTSSACCRRPSSVLRVSDSPSSVTASRRRGLPGEDYQEVSPSVLALFPLSSCFRRGFWVCAVGLEVSILRWNSLSRLLPGYLANPWANEFGVYTRWISSVLRTLLEQCQTQLGFIILISFRINGEKMAKSMKLFSKSRPPWDNGLSWSTVVSNKQPCFSQSLICTRFWQSNFTRMTFLNPHDTPLCRWEHWTTDRLPCSPSIQYT